MTSLKQYEDQLKAYSDDTYIGYLVWYSVPDSVRVPFKELTRTIIKTFGADQTDMPLPRRPKAHDVFKRACSSIGKIKVDYTPADAEDLGHVSRYTIHDAGNDAGAIYREVVKEVLDKEGHTLSHKTIGKFTFIRAARVIDTDYYDDEGVSDTDSQIMRSIDELVQDYYNTNLHNLTSTGIRSVILDMLHYVFKAYTARASGGVYFVSKEHGDFLFKLSDALAKVTNPEGTERVDFHFLPLINDERQRETLKYAFTLDVKQRLNEIMGDVGNLLKDGQTISPKRFQTIHGRFKEVDDLVGEQKELLQDGLDTASAATKLLKAQMKELLGNVRPE